MKLYKQLLKNYIEITRSSNSLYRKLISDKQFLDLTDSDKKRYVEAIDSKDEDHKDDIIRILIDKGCFEIFKFWYLNSEYIRIYGGHLSHMQTIGAYNFIEFLSTQKDFNVSMDTNRLLKWALWWYPVRKNTMEPIVNNLFNHPRLEIDDISKQLLEEIIKDRDFSDYGREYFLDKIQKAYLKSADSLGESSNPFDRLRRKYKLL